MTNAEDLSDVVAVINGKELNKGELSAYVLQRVGGQAETVKTLNPNQKNMLFNEFINMELLHQDAIDKKMHKTLSYEQEINFHTRNILANQNINEITSKPVPEETLQALFKQQYSKPLVEYNLKHILLKDEETATKIIDSLNKGKDFTELAKQSSIDPSGQEGGDLGWVTYENLLSPLNEVLLQIEKGTYNKTPVQSQFGWHVLFLVDTREAPQPSFDDVKDQLNTQYQNQIITKYIEALRNKGKIEIK